MGSGSSNRVGNIDVNSDQNLIDGNYGEYGEVFIGKNNLADFVFDHRFIFVDVEECDHYKIYEWTKHGLKMFASDSYPIYERKYLGYANVKDVYNISKRISSGKEFSLVSFNCKDWVKEFKKKFRYVKQ